MPRFPDPAGCGLPAIGGGGGSNDHSNATHDLKTELDLPDLMDWYAGLLEIRGWKKVRAETGKTVLVSYWRLVDVDGWAWLVQLTLSQQHQAIGRVFVHFRIDLDDSNPTTKERR